MVIPVGHLISKQSLTCAIAKIWLTYEAHGARIYSAGGRGANAKATIFIVYSLVNWTMWTFISKPLSKYMYAFLHVYSMYYPRFYWYKLTIWAKNLETSQLLKEVHQSGQSRDLVVGHHQVDLPSSPPSPLESSNLPRVNSFRFHLRFQRMGSPFLHTRYGSGILISD